MDPVAKKFEIESEPDTPVHTFDVAIVGGGILGLATACELLSLGYSTVVIDDAPEDSATSASGGMLSPFAELSQTEQQRELMVEALQSYPDFVANVERTAGCRIEINFPGTLYIDTASDVPLDELTYRFRESGADASYLDPNDVTQNEPSLEIGDNGAILLADEGYVEPRQLHRGLRAAFELLGGVWRSAHALDLEFVEDRICGVRTGHGFEPARSVFCSAGAWGARFLTEDDQKRYEPTPVRGEIVRVRPTRRRDSIRHILHGRDDVYLVPQEDGTVLVGATSSFNDGTLRTTNRGVRELLDKASRIVPILDEWEFLEAWSGIRPMARDGAPQLVDDPRPGLFHGIGLYRHGILLGPTLGARMARRIAAYLFQSGGRRELLG